MAVGAPATVTLTVANADQLASTDGQVEVTLPAGLSLVTAPTGCTVSATGFTCPLAHIAASGNVSLPFQIQAAAPVSNVLIQAVVSQVTSEVNLGNNSASLLVSAPGHPDLVSAITGSASLSVGGAPGTYTAMVTNQGNLDSTDGTLTVTLPAGLTLVPASLPAHCTAVATGFSCTLTGLAQGGSTAVAFAATASSAFDNQSVQVQVTSVSGEEVTANNNAALAVSATAAGGGTPQPVPGLSVWALLILAAWIALGAAWARRRPLP